MLKQVEERRKDGLCFGGSMTVTFTGVGIGATKSTEEREAAEEIIGQRCDERQAEGVATRSRHGSNTVLRNAISTSFLETPSFSSHCIT